MVGPRQVRRGGIQNRPTGACRLLTGLGKVQTHAADGHSETCAACPWEWVVYFRNDLMYFSEHSWFFGEKRLGRK